MQTEISGYSAARLGSKWLVFLPSGRKAFTTKAKAELYISHIVTLGTDYAHGIGCYCHSLTASLPRGY